MHVRARQDVNNFDFKFWYNDINATSGKTLLLNLAKIWFTENYLLY